MTGDKVHLVVNAVGVDRPGIVSEMTKHVTDVGGNVGQSKASTMGSNLFSVMMLVQVPSAKAEGLQNSLQSIGGLNTSVFETEPQDAVKISPKIGCKIYVCGRDYAFHAILVVVRNHSQVYHFFLSSTDAGRFTLSGADNPGIVHKVTSLLAKFHVSIVSMETTEAPAPHGGTTLFLMEGLVSAQEPLGKDFDINKIRALLEELGDSLNCDITLEDVFDGEGMAA